MLAQVMSLLQFPSCGGVSANELAPGLLTHFFLQHSRKPKVQEDPSLEVRTPIHVFGFHVPVDDFEGVHFLHALEELFLFFVGQCIVAQRSIVNSMCSLSRRCRSRRPSRWKADAIWKKSEFLDHLI